MRIKTFLGFASRRIFSITNGTLTGPVPQVVTKRHPATSAFALEIRHATWAILTVSGLGRWGGLCSKHQYLQGRIPTRALVVRPDAHENKGLGAGVAGIGTGRGAFTGQFSWSR